MFEHKKSLPLLFLLSSLIFGAAVTGCSKKTDDYGHIVAMRNFSQDAMGRHGAQLRPESKRFLDYYVDLSWFFGIFFGNGDLDVHLYSYKSERMAVASFTQMEVPPNSKFFLDLAFEIRPAANMRAPLFHGDVIKPMPGIDGMFAVDFYNTNPKDLDVDSFLGDRLSEIRRALKLVASYQKTKEQGRGKLTPHLDPFKSKYRIELLEPDQSDVKRHQAYFKAVRESYQITLSAYLTALGRLNKETDKAVIERNKKGHDKFMDILDKEDIAAKLSSWMFDEDYKAYFFDGFWGRGQYGVPDEKQLNQ